MKRRRIFCLIPFRGEDMIVSLSWDQGITAQLEHVDRAFALVRYRRTKGDYSIYREVNCNA